MIEFHRKLQLRWLTRSLCVLAGSVGLACTYAPTSTAEGAPTSKPMQDSSGPLVDENETNPRGWIDLFDGESLDGWTQRNGTATYRVEDGAIVGQTADGSPNSFLCTDENYGDFELVFEVKVDSPLNSGVQIRSRTEEPQRGRVSGPQVEIEAAGPAGSLSGYVYGEAAGGWMTPDEDRTRHPHFKNAEWNTYRVVAVGPTIRTWINGELVGDLNHPERFESHPSGFIGLQVHGIPAGSGPYQVRWRNIRLRHLESLEDADFVDLYNGKDLAGWTTQGNWLVQDDGSLLVDPREGEAGWQRYDHYLWTDQIYENFILDVEYMYPTGGNSGIYFRVADTNNPVYTGIEAQVLDSSQTQRELTAHDHGGIIFTAAPSRNMSQPPSEWNRMIITCNGNHLQVELNGESIINLQLDETDLRDRPAAGYIGLQEHGQPHTLRFRNIRIKELPGNADAENPQSD